MPQSIFTYHRYHSEIHLALFSVAEMAFVIAVDSHPGRTNQEDSLFLFLCSLVFGRLTISAAEKSGSAAQMRRKNRPNLQVLQGKMGCDAGHLDLPDQHKERGGDL